MLSCAPLTMSSAGSPSMLASLAPPPTTPRRPLQRASCAPSARRSSSPMAVVANPLKACISAASAGAPAGTPIAASSASRRGRNGAKRGAASGASAGAVRREYGMVEMAVEAARQAVAHTEHVVGAVAREDAALHKVALEGRRERQRAEAEVGPEREHIPRSRPMGLARLRPPPLLPEHAHAPCVRPTPHAPSGPRPRARLRSALACARASAQQWLLAG